MTGWDRGDPPEPSGESLERVKAGRNRRFSGFQEADQADPGVARVLLRYREAVARATEEAFLDLVKLLRS